MAEEIGWRNELRKLRKLIKKFGGKVDGWISGLSKIRYMNCLQQSTIVFISDRMLWTGSAGYNRSVPVYAKITGFMTKPGTEGEKEMIDVSVIFDAFDEKEPSPGHFNPPSDIW